MPTAPKRNRAAFSRMAFAALAFSLTPLMVAAVSASESPFLFNASIYLGQGVFLCALFAATNRRAFASAEARKELGRGLADPRLLLTAAAYANFGLFALSTRFINVSAATVTFGAWPIFMALFTARLFRGEKRYRRISARTLFLILMGMAGFGLAVLSQSGNGAKALSSGAGWTESAAGSALALGAAGLTALSSYGLRLGADIGFRLSEASPAKNRESLEMAGVLAAVGAASFAAAPLNIAIGFWIGGERAGETVVRGREPGESGRAIRGGGADGLVQPSDWSGRQD